MIKSVELINWRSHENTKLEFSKGVNLFVGPIGSGKSSIIDAICFALFGSFPALKSRRVSLEETIKNFPEKKGSATVKLIMEWENKKYEIVRKISKGSEAYIRENDVLLEGPQSQRVNEIIEKMLKIDYDLFVRAIYSEQNNIEYFFELRGGERRKQIDNLLGLDKFERARSNTGNIVNKMKKMQAEMEAYLKGAEPEENEKKFSELKNEKDELEKELEKGRGEMGRIKNELEKTIKIVSELEEKEKKFGELDKKLESINSILRELEENSKIKKMQITEWHEEGEIDKIKEKLENEVKEIKVKIDERNKISNEKSRIEGSIANLQKEIVKYENVKNVELEKYQQTLKKAEEELDVTKKILKESSEKLNYEKSREEMLKEQIENMRKEKEKMLEVKTKIGEIEREYGGIEKLKLKISEDENEEKEIIHEIAAEKALKESAENALKELSKNVARCPVCDSPLTESKRRELIEEKDRVVRRMKENIEKDELKLKRTREKIKSMKEKLENAVVMQKGIEGKENIEKKLFESINEDEKIRGEAGVLEKEIKEKELRVEKLEKDIEDNKETLRRREEYEKIEKELGKKKEEYEKAERDFEELSKADYEKELEKAREEINDLEKLKEIFEIERKIKENKKEEEKIKNEINALNFNIEELKEKRETKNKSEKQLAVVEEQINNFNKKIKEITEELKNIGEKIRKIKEEQKKIEKIKEKIEQMTIFQNSIVEAQSVMREEMLSAINNALDEIWPKLYPYKDFTSMKLDVEKDYGAELKINGEWIDIERVSGGERSAAALTLRIAFATVLTPNLSWLVLDEPTHNLDVNAVKELAKALKEEIPKIVEQVFIVTHDETLKEGIDANVFEFRRDKANLGATVVEKIK